VLAVTAYAALAAVQILVLNPLAAAPGLTLTEIRGRMSDAGESLMPGTVLGILGLGVAMAIGVAVVCLVTRAHPVVPAMTFLAVLMGGAPAYFVASFGPGMALADTFMIGGADASPWAIPLFAVSALAAVGILVGVAFTARRRGPAPAAA
jgi:hypothetical protein